MIPPTIEATALLSIKISLKFKCLIKMKKIFIQVNDFSNSKLYSSGFGPDELRFSWRILSKLSRSVSCVVKVGVR